MIDTKRAYLALDKFAKANTGLVEALRAAGITTLEAARPVVIAWAAARAGCALVESTHHLAKTPKVLDRNHTAFSAAQRSVQRVMAVLNSAAKSQDAGGDAVSHRSAPKETVRVPREIAALAAKLIAACSEYKGAKRLAAQAVAEGFARVK